MGINLSAIRARLFSADTGPGNDIQLKDMGILDHIEKIVGISQKYGIEKCLSKGKKYLDYVTGKLGINPIQAVLFSQFMERCSDNHIAISEIADAVKCSKVRIIKYMNECEALEKKKLIRCSRGDSVSYRIPREVHESLRKCNEFIPENKSNLSVSRFFFLNRSLMKEATMN